MVAQTNLLTLRGIWKSFAEPVLRDVGLELRAGEVHALVGENGAGKTTLAKIISGLLEPERGSMHLRGKRYAPADKGDAERHGVRMVMQELHLVANLSVAENIFLRTLPSRLGVIDYPRLHKAAREVMTQVGLGNVAPDTPVHRLGVGQQQLVEIAAALAGRCDVLILDEPTAALTDAEVELLFERVRTLRAAGVGILYISHRMEEIGQIADRITVLRDGQVVGTRPADAPLDEIIRMMVGRDLGEVARAASPQPGPVALEVEGLRRDHAVRDVSFAVRRGEILGLAGLMGSGRTETLRIRSPRDAVRLGIALLTEDRKAHGLLLPLSVRVNATLANLRQLLRPGGVVDTSGEDKAVRRLVRLLSIQCRSTEQPVQELSGGNQQKVVFARWLYRDCEVLLLDEPTRGIDIGAKFEVYQLLNDLAGAGKAIVVVSSDLIELMSICDRVAVMSAGRLVATFERGEWSEEKIMEAALSGYTSRQEALVR